jgi:hypothetical protein
LQEPFDLAFKLQNPSKPVTRAFVFFNLTFVSSAESIDSLSLETTAGFFTINTDSFPQFLQFLKDPKVSEQIYTHDPPFERTVTYRIMEITILPGTGRHFNFKLDMPGTLTLVHWIYDWRSNADYEDGWLVFDKDDKLIAFSHTNS